MRRLTGLLTALAVTLVPAAPALLAETPPPAKAEDKFPKVPGSKTKWDLADVEEVFTIVRGGVKDDSVYFLLELKQDMKQFPLYRANYYDADGVKYAFTAASFGDATLPLKKGDRVRLTLGDGTKDYKERWAKAVNVKIVAQ